MIPWSTEHSRLIMNQCESWMLLAYHGVRMGKRQDDRSIPWFLIDFGSIHFYRSLQWFHEAHPNYLWNLGLTLHEDGNWFFGLLLVVNRAVVAIGKTGRLGHNKQWKSSKVCRSQQFDTICSLWRSATWSAESIMSWQIIAREITAECSWRLSEWFAKQSK